MQAELQPVSVAGSPEEKFAEFLTLTGKRFSRTQRQLVRHIFSYHEHFTANKLVSDVERIEIGVSRATVYRTLASLVSAGLLRKHRFGDVDAYEHDYGYPEHDHICCSKCGKIVEFQSAELAAILERVAREQRFRLASHRLVVTGVCEGCQYRSGSRRKLDMI